MSQPKRYYFISSNNIEGINIGVIIHEDEKGPFVLHEDYASLSAENERLRADASEASSLQSFLKWKGMEWEYKEWLDWRAERPVTLTNSKTWQVLGEYAEAKEQIARLENAGEKMADIVWHIRTPEAHEALHDWLAAKKGRDAK